MEFKTLQISGWQPAIQGMRNPLKSYDKADSCIEIIDPNYVTMGQFIFGPNDYKLAKGLWKGGTEHRKWMRQVIVWVKITAPRYWWSEFDTYKIGTSANSESTMHTLLKEDFDESQFEWPFEANSVEEHMFITYIKVLKAIRDKANGASTPAQKEAYHRILKAMLPESFLQTRTICLNYEVLATMYRQRKNHRLPEWNTDFVSWIKTLPHNEFITGEFDD